MHVADSDVRMEWMGGNTSLTPVHFDLWDFTGGFYGIYLCYYNFGSTDTSFCSKDSFYFQFQAISLFAAVEGGWKGGKRK
jgi:hypothetical protein